MLVEDQLAEGDRVGLEGRFGVARGRVDGGLRVFPAGVRPGRPLEVLEGDAGGEALGVGVPVVVDF